jgi:hypothetical protein
MITLRRYPMRRQERRGAILILVAMLALPLLGMIAFAVDYGYLLKVRCDLQRSADCTALAAVQDLTPDTLGYQDLGAVRATIQDYVAQNIDNSFTVLDSDIDIGRYDSSTIYSNVSLLNTGIFDTVRVTLRRDSQANNPVSLFFSRVFGSNSADVVATGTAVLQKGRYLPPGANVLPFGVPLTEWNSLNPGDAWVIYGDGQIEDSSGNSIPGNWGTLDIGSENNSTSDMGDQIVNGLDQSHLDSLYADGRITTDTHIDAQATTWLQADTGISTGMKAYVRQVHGKNRIIPLYETTTDSGGNNLEFKISGWGVVKVIDSQWLGAHNTYVEVQKAYIYDGDLRPNSSLNGFTNIIAGAYTSPVLVE